MRLLSISIAALSLSACLEETTDSAAGAASPISIGQSWRIATQGDLNEFFECLETQGATLVSAHRAGPYPGFPENAIETMQAVLADAPAIFEIDVATTSDGVLYLMHDDSLDRTTTGRGPSDQVSWETVSDVKLRDNDGQVTDFSPPTFAAFLRAAKDVSIVQIDFKRSTRYEDVIAEVERQDASDRVIYIAYSMAAARKLHRLAPNSMISLSLNSQTDLNRAVAAGVPDDKLVAFTGTDEPSPRLNNLLDDRDVEVIFGTLGGRDSIDNEIRKSGDDARYAEIAALGVDILGTDRPLEAHRALLADGRGVEPGQCGVNRG